MSLGRSIYVSLLRNQWKSFIRSLRGKRPWIVGLALLPLGLYVGAVLVTLGLFFDRIPGLADSEQSSLEVLNGHLLSLLVGMLAIRFFFQRPPRMSLQAYLHLPVERMHLVRYFQVASLASLHNLYPFLFLIPFWYRHVAPPHSDLSTALTWLAAVILCLLLSHYLNILVRIVLDRFTNLFLLLVALLVGVQIIDQALGTEVISSVSAWFFNAMTAPTSVPFLAITVLTAAVFVGSGRSLLHSLNTESSPAMQRRLHHLISFGRSVVLNLVLLELKLMWRNKRSRQYVLVSVGVSTAYTALLLSDYNAAFGSLIVAAVGLFASGVFALNYGQLMFAWESRFFDGILARDIKPEQMVMAKFIVLQGSCLVLFLISLPLFLWLAPALLLLHVAFLFYNAGVTSMLMLILAVFNQKRVDADHGTFFNYQGFSALHWMWIIPTIAPPAFIIYMLDGAIEQALSVIALLGLASMLAAWPWSTLLAQILTRRRHLMAAGFRTVET